MNSSYSTEKICGSEGCLQTIAVLRRKCWSRYYPEMSHWAEELFFDDLDSTSIHLVTSNEEGQPIAANRISIFDQVGKLPFSHLLNLSLYPDDSFAYFSKLVVDPDYRKLGLKENLDSKRLELMNDLNLKFGMGLYDKHRIQEVKFQGFLFMEEISKGIQDFFPYTSRTLQVMCIPQSCASKHEEESMSKTNLVLSFSIAMEPDHVND